MMGLVDGAALVLAPSSLKLLCPLGEATSPTLRNKDLPFRRDIAPSKILFCHFIENPARVGEGKNLISHLLSINSLKVINVS